MDQITHDIRRANWLNLIQQRPASTTVKQWCLDNGIREKSYYYWQRKFRKEMAGQMEVPSAVPKNEAVAFTEVPFSCTASPLEASDSEELLSGHPAAVLKCGSFTIAVTNDISDALLSRIIREVSHA